MRCAVYSGTFDPLHIGHLAIVRHLCSVCGFDRVLLVVSPQNPLKDASVSGNALSRYEQACAAVARHSELRVEVDDIEMRMEAPHYTIRTLDALRVREPSAEFTLAIGADNLSCIRRWKDYQRLLLEYGVVVFPRKGFDAIARRKDLMRENPSYKIEIARMAEVNVAATEIREALAAGKDVSGLLF